jgi:hypothetical protein
MTSSSEQLPLFLEAGENSIEIIRSAIGLESVRIWSNPGMDVLNTPSHKFVNVNLEQNVALMHFSIRWSSVPASLEGKELYITSNGSIINASEEPYNLNIWPNQNVPVQVLSRGFSPCVRTKDEAEEWQRFGQPVAVEDFSMLLDALRHIEPFDKGLIE